MDLQVKVDLWQLIAASATGALWIVLLGQRVKQLEKDYATLCELLSLQSKNHSTLELKVVEELGKIQAALSRIEAKMESLEDRRV